MEKDNSVQVKKNIRWGIAISFISLVVSIFSSIFVSRKVLDFIGDYNYGLYSFVLSITNWLTVISGALNASFVRFSTIEEIENGNPNRTNTIYLKLLSIITVVLLIGALALLGGFYFNHANLFSYDWEDSRVLYLLFLFSIINIGISIPTSIYGLFIQYKKKFIFSRLTSLFISVLTSLAHFFIAWLTKDIVWIAISGAILTALSAIIQAIYSHKCLNIRFSSASLRENRVLLRQITIFSAILLFNSIVDQINNDVDKTLLGIFASPNDVTVYQFGQQFNNYLMTMSVAVSSTFVPTINELVIKGKDEELNELYLKISHWQTIIMTIIPFGFLSCGYYFVYAWLGESRIDVYYLGAFRMLLSMCPYTINSSIEIQRARNKHLFRAIVYFACALANVGLSILFLFIFDKKYATYACILGTIITTLISHWIIMNIYNAKVMKLPVGKQMLTLGKYCLIGLIGFGVCYLFGLLPFMKNLESIVAKFLIFGFLFVFVFGIFMIIFDRKFLKENALDKLKAKLNKKKNNSK